MSTGALKCELFIERSHIRIFEYSCKNIFIAIARICNRLILMLQQIISSIYTAKLLRNDRSLYVLKLMRLQLAINFVS